MLKWQVPLLALLILIVPACGGNQTVTPPLFQDSFSGSFPGTNWSAVQTTGAMAPTVGIVAGLLEFAAAGASSSATTMTQATFAIPSVSFSVQMAVTSSAGLIGDGRIEIIDGTNAAIASVIWNPDGNSLTYAILGVPVAPVTPPMSNGMLNHFVFSIDSAGKGTWSLNNVPVVNSSTVITATPLRVQLITSFGTGSSWPVFDFDNVTVTNP